MLITFLFQRIVKYYFIPNYIPQRTLLNKHVYLSRYFCWSRNNTYDSIVRATTITTDTTSSFLPRFSKEEWLCGGSPGGKPRERRKRMGGWCDTPACDTLSDNDSIPCNGPLNFATPDHMQLIADYGLVVAERFIKRAYSCVLNWMRAQHMQ